MRRRRTQSDEGDQYFVPTQGQRLGEKLSHVPNAGNVLHEEPELANPILQPVKLHVAGLGHLGLDGAVGEAHGNFIVAMDRRGRLRVSEVGENLAFLVGDLCGGERAPVLRFLNGRAHHGDARGVHGDGGIDEGGVVVPREMVEGRGHAASVGPGEERSVGEDVEGHGGRPKNFHAVAMGGHEPQETLQVGHGVEGGSGLCAGQRAGGGKSPAVDTAPIVEEIAYCYLELFLLRSGGGWGGIGGCVLRGGRAVNGRVIDGR